MAETQDIYICFSFESSKHKLSTLQNKDTLKDVVQWQYAQCKERQRMTEPSETSIDTDEWYRKWPRKVRISKDEWVQLFKNMTW